MAQLRLPHITLRAWRWQGVGGRTWNLGRVPVNSNDGVGARHLEFEWDEEKALRNFEVRGVHLEKAALIFQGPILVEPDQRRDYGEQRFKATGMRKDLCYVVIYTLREERIRIITAWYGGRRDRAKYQAYLAG